MHTVAKTQDGRLYSWGRADNGQLGIGRQWLEASDAECSGVRECLGQHRLAYADGEGG